MFHLGVSSFSIRLLTDHSISLWMTIIDVYGRFCAHGRLNGPTDFQR